MGLLPVAKVAVEWLQSCYGLSHSQTTELHSDLVYRGLSLVVTALSLSTTSLSLVHSYIRSGGQANSGLLYKHKMKRA